MGSAKLLVLQYHTKDQYATQASEGRVNDYKVKGFPTIILNGVKQVLGGSSGSYNQQTTAIEKEAAKGAAVTLSVPSSFSPESAAGVTVTNVSGFDISNAKLMAVVYEDLGKDEHHYLVREVLAPVVFSLPSGSSQNYEFTARYQGKNLNLVVFIQAANGEVLQAAATDNPPAPVAAA